MDWPALARAPPIRVDPVGPSAVTAPATRDEKSAPQSTGRKVALLPQQLRAAAGPKDSVAEGATPVDAAPLQVTLQSSPLPLITVIGARF
jgi:hypothetical protein